jgi:hypothetical protein
VQCDKVARCKSSKELSHKIFKRIPPTLLLGNYFCHRTQFTEVTGNIPLLTVNEEGVFFLVVKTVTGVGGDQRFQGGSLFCALIGRLTIGAVLPLVLKISQSGWTSPYCVFLLT